MCAKSVKGQEISEAKFLVFISKKKQKKFLISALASKMDQIKERHIIIIIRNGLFKIIKCHYFFI
jgi:hypothetical protein